MHMKFKDWLILKVNRLNFDVMFIVPWEIICYNKPTLK